MIINKARNNLTNNQGQGELNIIDMNLIRYLFTRFGIYCGIKELR